MRLGVREALVGGRIVPGDVEVVDGEITAAGLAPGGRGLAVPGFVDLQVNGRGDVDLLTADEAARERLSSELAEAGTTAWRPTLISAPEADLVRALGGAWPSRCLGVHVEGPFLSPERGGAHPPEHLRAPDLGELRRLLDAGPVSQVTLAPELPGAEALIDELTARGVLVSAGHTAATAAPFDRIRTRDPPVQRDGARARRRRARRPARDGPDHRGRAARAGRQGARRVRARPRPRRARQRLRGRHPRRAARSGRPAPRSGARTAGSPAAG